MAGLRVPLSWLHPRPYDRPRRTRGQDGSLFLSCTALSSATPCRFIPALSFVSFHTHTNVKRICHWRDILNPQHPPAVHLFNSEPPGPAHQPFTFFLFPFPFFLSRPPSLEPRPPRPLGS